MNILGYEIDCSFIYRVSHIKMETSRKDAYLIFFILSLKDGKEHNVEISYNYTTFNYQGGDYVRSIKNLSEKQTKLVPAKFKKDLGKIKLLRTEIINEMNKK